MLESGRVVKHIEAWDVNPAKVVQQLFSPSRKGETRTVGTRAQGSVVFWGSPNP